MKSSEIDHLLSTLAEECAEVIQRITKAQRWGLHEIQPGQSLNNEQRIEYELNDLIGVVTMLLTRGVFPNFNNAVAIKAKVAKVEHFMEYARELGELE